MGGIMLLQDRFITILSRSLHFACTHFHVRALKSLVASYCVLYGMFVTIVVLYSGT
jgi:hypothetical protein